MSLDLASELLTKAKVFFLATVNGDKPAARPFGVYNIFEGKLYLATSNDKAVFSQLVANPQVQLTANLPEKWFRIDGTLIVDKNEAAKVAFFETNPWLKKAYEGDAYEAFEVLYFETGTVTVYEKEGEIVSTF
jgi:uncharacterized pyridoxamine 5'-phosphate oxidase family protein